VLPYQTEQCRECLLLCKVSRGSENDDNGILLELHGTITSVDQHLDGDVNKFGFNCGLILTGSWGFRLGFMEGAGKMSNSTYPTLESSS
jgi:hypothetical protein